MSTANIEAWRGSVGDIQEAVEIGCAALAEDGDPNVRVSVHATDWLGAHHTYASLDEFDAGSRSSAGADPLSVRVELESDGGTSAAIVARRRLPGIVLEVQGSSRLKVDGLARELFRPLMRGYVDRYAGWWRPTLAIAITSIPVILTFAVATSTEERWPAWATAVTVLAGLGISFVVMVNSWQWTLVRTPLDFVPDDAPVQEGLRARFERLRQRPWLNRLLALLGVLAIGIATNKISDLIDWP